MHDGTGLFQYASLGSMIFPESLNYSAAAFYDAFQSVSTLAAQHVQSFGDGLVQVILASISSAPALIGGVTLFYGAKLSHTRKLAADERDHAYRMAVLEKQAQRNTAPSNTVEKFEIRGTGGAVSKEGDAC